MSKYGFNEKELRKTIVTKIDKDGFHEQTVTYGKDSGGSSEGSGDWSIAHVTFSNQLTDDIGFWPIIQFDQEHGVYSAIPASASQIGNMAMRLSPNEHGVLDFPLYKGRADIAICMFYPNEEDTGLTFDRFMSLTPETISYTPQIINTGACTYYMYSISGDGELIANTGTR